jgi:hypothetical protein
MYGVTRTILSSLSLDSIIVNEPTPLTTQIVITKKKEKERER